jgi:hypothetical protein
MAHPPTLTFMPIKSAFIPECRSISLADEKVAVAVNPARRTSTFQKVRNYAAQGHATLRKTLEAPTGKIPVDQNVRLKVAVLGRAAGPVEVR